jgi:putative DNA methylase
VKDKLEAEIGSAYPTIIVDDALVTSRPDLREYQRQRLPTVAWLWARTVRSPDPSVHGAFVPLVTTFRLRSKGDQKVWIEPDVDKAANTYRFIVKTGKPTLEQAAIAAAGTKTGRGANFKCLLSGSPLDESYIRSQCESHETGYCLLAVVAEGKGRSRVYLPPSNEHYLAAMGCQAPSWAPDQPMDQKCADLVSGRGYGFTSWSELFTRRQLLVHSTLCRVIQETQKIISQHATIAGVTSDSRSLTADGSGVEAYAEALSVYLSFAMIRSIDYSSAFASWRHKDSALRSTLAKQAIPMVWDFAEANPFNKSSGGFLDCANVVAKCLEFLPAIPAGNVTQLDATEAVLNLQSPVVCCDPPYYSNISYAELSDFLYVWLRRALSGTFQSLFSTLLTPKSRELVAATHRHDGNGEAAKSFFEQGLRAAFSQMRKGANQECPVTIFYAFKQSEEDDDDEDTVEGTVASTGWETMLDALISSGFQVSGTWPMRTEGDNRQVGVGRNALASSIVFVCRPRPVTAPLATRKELMNRLRSDLPEALKNLQHGNIAPVDMAQAAIGPGMSVFTRYAKVLESDGKPMSVRTALGLINQTLDEVLVEQEGEFDGDTRWALSWFEQFGMDEGPFGDAETLSKAKNTAINGLQEAGIIVAKSGKVRLIRRDELPEDWNPRADKRLTIWEVTQHLIYRLDQKGETGAAELVSQLGGIGETARDLAYRLYSTCERKKWAQEALAYNSLVVAWPELTKLAHSSRTRQETTQRDLGF